MRMRHIYNCVHILQSSRPKPFVSIIISTRGVSQQQKSLELLGNYRRRRPGRDTPNEACLKFVLSARFPTPLRVSENKRSFSTNKTTCCVVVISLCTSPRPTTPAHLLAIVSRARCLTYRLHCRRNALYTRRTAAFRKSSSAVLVVGRVVVVNTRVENNHDYFSKTVIYVFPIPCERCVLLG